ncbi:unnamed protein product [Paramecium pentaurelia]|uniref:Uncharacterized protein n=1 Tax=Paramecium pentaurelia TaxID=43138 RepID=A0A8S1X0N3_9CILI|nr:unnamed protein product [Paramecium pentaurelia]
MDKNNLNSSLIGLNLFIYTNQMENKTKQKMKVEELWRICQSEIIVNSFVWINKNLFKKYCQSQNYYYTRDVNEILRDASSKAVVQYKDWIGYDDDDEYLKRYYYYEDEYPQKIQLLSEYYKFHTDIPRIFMEPIILLLNKYYDKKRRYEYYRIARLIEEENKKNPNGPPKCIIGEGPSLANSQESYKNQESQTQVKRIRNTQILKDLSWLNKSQSQIQKNGIENSYTLQEICKQLGKVTLEQSSLLISSGKGDEMQLDKFLSYLNLQTQKTQRDKVQLIQKYSKKLSQPHEQLVQTFTQKQHHDDVSKQRLGSQHFIQKTELIQQKNKISSDININCINNQVDTLQKQSNHTRMDQNDLIKQSITFKSKTIVQPKISNQQFLKEIRQNVQSIPQLLNYQNQNPILSPIQSNAYLQTQTINQISIGKLNLKQISKIFIEDDPYQQELKWKNGAQTHRPNSGTKNFFSNRNSPIVQRGTQNEQRTNVLKQTSSQITAAYSQIQQKQSQKNIKAIGSSTNRKSIQPNIHFRYRSNQDNNNNNIHQNLQLKQAQHQKNRSDGKLLNQPLLNTQHQFICLTDRAGEYIFKNSLVASYQNSPKTNIQKRVGNGIGTFKNSESPKNSLIKQMLLTQVQKQQQRQECFSLQLRKPN